ncbi:proline dehydrogenase family protein [Halalkalibacter alkaliphilus]|uniref:proline dehydrogenase n=1 Tax=Halalkalibacter alkaliphilus TaxID=2917993 RepID=A0A9X2CRY3_9BACI|nr:proline dehydrogenase [Halalkalibacter alkaliphilus]MCL7747077.1 proline dehydrogenase [Halalkalibacter alkaliphilus]
MVEKLSKNFFLYLSKNKILNKGAKRWGLKLGAAQVVAGVTVDSVIKVVKVLNKKGLVCTVDHLGEFVLNRDEAKQSMKVCIETLEAMSATGVNCNLSLKLTQLGLDIDRQLCIDHMKAILDAAKKTNNFVRIDMEDYSHYHQTLEILAELRQTYDNVGTVLQAYLHSGKKDLESLRGVPLRLVKGAYKESPKVAYQNKEKIDENYLEMIKQHLLTGSHTAIATHDHRIIEKVKRFCKKWNIPKSQFEFQMLYGFRTELQEQIAKEGYTMRVYVPFGHDWYGYFMRRLAERPQNVSFALKGLFSKK